MSVPAGGWPPSASASSERASGSTAASAGREPPIDAACSAGSTPVGAGPSSSPRSPDSQTRAPGSASSTAGPTSHATAVSSSPSAVNVRGGSSTKASGQVDTPLRGAGAVASPAGGRPSCRSSALYAECSSPSVPRAADAASSSSAAVRSARSRPKSGPPRSSCPGSGRNASARSAQVSERSRAALISACTRARTCSYAPSPASSPGASGGRSSVARSCTSLRPLVGSAVPPSPGRPRAEGTCPEAPGHTRARAVPDQPRPKIECRGRPIPGRHCG